MNDKNSGPTGAGPSERTVDAATAAVLIVAGAVVMWDSYRIGIGWATEGPQSGYFPFYIGLIMAAASAVTLAQAIVRGRAGDETFVTWERLRLVMVVLIPTAIYVAIIPWTGIYVPSAVFIAFFMRWLDKYAWHIIVPIAVGVPVALFVMFEIWFLVPLPKGPLEELLGF